MHTVPLPSLIPWMFLSLPLSQCLLSASSVPAALGRRGHLLLRGCDAREGSAPARAVHGGRSSCHRGRRSPPGRSEAGGGPLGADHAAGQGGPHRRPAESGEGGLCKAGCHRSRGMLYPCFSFSFALGPTIEARVRVAKQKHRLFFVVLPSVLFLQPFNFRIVDDGKRRRRVGRVCEAGGPLRKLVGCIRDANPPSSWRFQFSFEFCCFGDRKQDATRINSSSRQLRWWSCGVSRRNVLLFLLPFCHLHALL
jgi:hypothetical protein